VRFRCIVGHLVSLPLQSCCVACVTCVAFVAPPPQTPKLGTELLQMKGTNREILVSARNNPP
jgi:hypothetical protein